MKKSLLSFLFICSLFLASHSQNKIIPYQQLQVASGVFFGAVMNPTNITVTFSGVSDRWIALGIGNIMAFSDVLMYSNGQFGNLHALGWNDYYNPTGSSTTLDGVQDWTVISNSVAAGQRTVVASRALNTGDANDAIISFASASLNLIWARGASPGFTISYHGPSDRGSGISLPWLSQPTASFSTASNTICMGSPVTFTNLTTGGQTTYTWNFAGANLATSSVTNPVVTYTAAGTFSVALTASNAVGTNSIVQINYITVNPTVVPTVSLSQTGGVNPICSGALATFSASPANGGPAPSYQWQVNGINAGGNSPTFTSATLTNPSTITCVMTTNSICAVPNTVTSSAFVVTVSSSAPASVNIAITSGGNPMCINSLTTFTAISGNGGNSPTYQWKINNVNVGTNSPTFTTNALANNDIITCQMVSSSSCAITPTALSSGITITVSAVLVPSVNVSVLGIGNPACAGNLITFSASPTNGGLSPSYQWQVNGVNSGSNAAVFSSSVLANGSVIKCIMNSSFPCASPNTATSSAITLTVNPTPVAPVISPSGSVNLCSGKSLTLSSSVPNGNAWSTGATAQSIVVSNPGIYFVNQTSLGCISLPSLPAIVVVIPSPTPSLTSIQPLCKDDAPALLQGNPTGGTYSGAGVSNSFFNPSVAGTGTFVVTYLYTDQNTCAGTASASILVSECLNIKTKLEAKSGIIVFPNPTDGKLTVSSMSEKIVYVKLTDISGKLIINKKLNSVSEVSVDISREVAGVYILEIGLESKVVYSRISKKD